MRTGADPKEPGAAEPRTRAARDPSSQTPIRQGWTIPPFFEEYRVISRLSQGGMGEVYLGHDTLLDRPVAIKFMNAIEADAWMREQFLTEARAAARLQHNNVVGVYRVGELGGRPYIVSEFVRGQSLDTLPAPVPWQRALELGIGLVRGLAAAHRGGVLHRDIKPSNSIISSSGEVKLLDFGLAEFIDGNVASTPPLRKAADPLAPSAGLGVSGTEETLDLSIGADELQRLRRAVQEERPVPVSVNPAAGSSVSPAAGSSTPLAGQPSSPGLIGWSSTPAFEPARSTRIAGTPHYMAPEIWLGEPSTRQSDIYGMGALLFELCTGLPPHHEARVSLVELCKAVNSRDVPSLSELVPGIDARFAEVVARCLRRRPEERYASGDELREALEQIRPREQPMVAPEGNPYRGLLAFEAEHRALFFGRSNEIGTLIERLRTETFLLVAADSGVGKSSLCRAGVLPLVAEGALKDGRKWTVLSMVPGRNPLLALCALLAPLLQSTEAQLLEHLRAEPTALGRELSAQLGERSGVVLFIDQLEEIVTIADAEEARIVGEGLGRLAQRLPGLRLLMTARSDFLARIAAVPGLGDEVARALYFLRPMQREKIRQAIVGPAQARGVRFESEKLVELLVEETNKTEGGLPLLQFALAELWDVRTGDAITLHSLEAIGGVSGALARHADQVVLSLPADQRLAARRILMRLVSIEGTRARRGEDELGADEASRQAIEALVRGRLIVPHATSDGILYEVAHEALLKGWGTLRQWLELFADSRITRQRIEDAAAEWVRLGRTREALWGGRQLADLNEIDPASLTPTERDFLAASRRALRRGRLLRNGALIAVPLMLSMLYGAVQYRHLRERGLRVEGHMKRGQVLSAVARKQDAELRELRRRAFAAFDSQDQAEGEKLWARALKLTGELEETYGRTSQAMEAALAVDPGRDDVRALLADSLLEAALAAERAQHVARRNDLVQRMALYDLRGERQRRLQEPALLSVATTPEGAAVKLMRYVEDERQRRGLAEEQDLGRTPLRNLSLKEGSYLLSIELPGRAAVRYPVLLGRGENLQVSLGLPARKAVPAGFVYIPPGRFLFGTSGDESVRQSFLSTVPLHEVGTGAYLIKRSEVSYAEWIEFLSALPPPDRLRHGIHVPKGGIGGGVELRELGAGRWQLALQPVTRAYVVRSGEILSYAARKLRKDQEWLRLPVSGIGLADVRAYAAWLDRSGRVPGARLCTEREWERAARGADDRELPHGSTLEPGDANFDETYGKDPASAGPDEVGSHPASQSPFGLSDMAGNVFEWTESSLAADEAVVRGGSYFMGAIASRSTNRTPVAADFRDPAIGARICATVPPG